MENQFNLKLQAWLNDENHTISDGCLLLLQMENNQIHYQNLIRHPNKVAVMQFLESELQKRLKVRLANITHKMVAEMEEKVKVIVKKHYAYQDAAAEGTSDEEFRKGKRADHDRLPEEIQALYVENLELLHRMREVHLKLRSLSLQQVSCPDSERYPFLKEIIELDKKSHENWKTYDHYILPDSSTSSSSSSPASSSSTSPAVVPGVLPAGDAASPSPSPVSPIGNNTPSTSPAVVPGDLPAGDAASPSHSPASPKSPKSTKKSASPKK